MNLRMAESKSDVLPLHHAPTSSEETCSIPLPPPGFALWRKLHIHRFLLPLRNEPASLGFVSAGVGTEARSIPLPAGAESSISAPSFFPSETIPLCRASFRRGKGVHGYREIPANGSKALRAVSTHSRACRRGVGYGARNHDTLNHNPVLCQLS